MKTKSNNVCEIDFVDFTEPLYIYNQMSLNKDTHSKQW